MHGCHYSTWTSANGWSGKSTAANVLGRFMSRTRDLSNCHDTAIMPSVSASRTTTNWSTMGHGKIFLHFFPIPISYVGHHTSITHSANAYFLIPIQNNNFTRIQQISNSNFLSNKAGYTANTSWGRVGRGGNARFYTFQLDHHGPTDQRTDGQMDKASYRVVCPEPKSLKTFLV